MKLLSRLTLPGALFGVLFLVGCSEKKSPESQAKNGHEPSDEQAVGATYQEGKGLILQKETQASIGLKLAQVEERSLQPGLSFSAQIYRAATESSRRYGRERTGFAYGTALISSGAAAQIPSGERLATWTRAGEHTSATGLIWKVDPSQSQTLGKAEVLVELPDTEHHLPVGAFVELHLPLGNVTKPVISVPRAAILQTSTGTFVYAQNGGFFLRTEIKTGAENSDYVEIIDGLYEGDTVAVTSVEALYLIELRSTKGGGHAH